MHAPYLLDNREPYRVGDGKDRYTETYKLDADGYKGINGISDESKLGIQNLKRRVENVFRQYRPDTGNCNFRQDSEHLEQLLLQNSMSN